MFAFTSARCHKQGVHNNVGNDIVAVLKDISEDEGKKSADSDATHDALEDGPYKVVVVAMADSGEGQNAMDNTATVS